MEEMADAGKLAGIFDLSPHDITDYLCGGIMPAAATRLQASCRRGVPQVVAPGCADIVLYGPVEDIPTDILKRKYVIHNPIHTHVKANHSEMFELGKFIAERLGQSKGYATVFVPSQGFSQLNRAGGPIYDYVNGRDNFMLTNSSFDAASDVLSMLFTKRWDNGLDMALGYAWTDGEDVSPMTSSVAASNFDNLALVGEPLLTRVDPTVDFNWAGGESVPGAGGDYFAVRWTGEVRAYVDGDYAFSTISDDGVRLSVDGQRRIDKWHDQPITSHHADVTVSGGRVPVRMEYYENQLTAGAHLTWTAVAPIAQWRGEYFPNRDRSGRGYNIVRHAGHYLALMEGARTTELSPELETLGELTKIAWEQDLSEGWYASPLALADHLIAFDRKGKMIVLAPDEKKLSIAELSQTLPARLIEQVMPWSRSRRWNCSLVYCEP